MGVVGDDCTSLDLSYNELTSITGVKHFQNLQELILDNNKLRDLKTLPCIPSLTTLSLNNNKVCSVSFAIFFSIEDDVSTKESCHRWDEYELFVVYAIRIC